MENLSLVPKRVQTAGLEESPSMTLNTPSQLRNEVSQRGWDWTKVLQPARGNSKNRAQSAQPFPHPTERATELGLPSPQSPAPPEHSSPGPTTVLKGQGPTGQQKSTAGSPTEATSLSDVLWTWHHSVLTHFGLHTSSDGELTTYAGCLRITHLLSHYCDIEL